MRQIDSKVWVRPNGAGYYLVEMKNTFKFSGYFSILLHFDAHPRALTDLLEIVKNPCLDQVFGNDSGGLSYLE